MMAPFSSGQPCPRCGTPLAHRQRSAVLICDACGFIPGITPLDSPATVPSEPPAEHSPLWIDRLPQQITYRGELAPRARSLYESGVAAHARGAIDQAIDNFRDALDMVPEFVDAHMALARLISAPDAQREHLSAVIAYDPGNAEALRLWMLLNGELTPEKAARAASGAEPEVRASTDPVQTQAAVLLCPVCSGHLTVDEVTQRVTCRFCGHEAALTDRREVGGRSLGAALIARKAEPVRWKVGERLLTCHQCGASRTVGATTLSAECPFCGSNQVIEQDAVKSFIQPDSLIPFVLTERDAVNLLKTALDRPTEKFAGLFDDNRVKSGIVNGVYVPYWLFDIIVNIRRTRVESRESRFGQSAFQPRLPVEEQFQDALLNFPIAGLRELDGQMADKILDYSYSDNVPYEPRQLARYPASLYDVDFDDASLRARSQAAQHMRDKHQNNVSDSETRVTVSAMVQSMSFSLVLLPFFVVTLKERDGDRRPALVNGQTGAVALGKAISP